MDRESGNEQAGRSQAARILPGRSKMLRRTIAVAMLTALALVSIVRCATADTPASIGETFRTDDWRTEKHVPVIDCPVEFVAGEPTTVTVTVGKEIPHPNTTTHHINWIRLYFLPADSNVPYEVGSFEFSAHGASVLGADTSTLYTDPKISVDFRTSVPGIFYATASCNIHGLWESAKAITVIGSE
jgi:superoxide reductase